MNDQSSSQLSKGRGSLKLRTPKAQGRGDFAKLDAGVRTSSVLERPENSAFDFKAAIKRRRGTSSDEEYAIREAAWEKNRGLISAKAYATRIGNHRREKAQKKA